ncbi:MAG: hypothetical protein Q6368_007825 [Candidatus Baldrarchaeota archaeon]|nr:MAG: hypothetical protein B6U96_07830 [Archaeoglobales archaeon ex4484_92]
MYLSFLMLGVSIGLIAIIGAKYLEWYRYARDRYNLLIFLFLVSSLFECLTLLATQLLNIHTLEIFWSLFSMFEISKWAIFACSVFFVEN